MKTFSLLLAGLLTCVSGVASAAGPDLADAVNRAGYQRMLSQRIVKAYSQLGLGVTPALSRAQLETSVDLFEQRLAELKPAAAMSRFATKDLERLNGLWREFRKVATGPVSKEGAAILLERGEEVLHTADWLTKHLQDAAGTSYSRLINISGRQRMLSQRLTKYYMLKVWGFDSAQVQEEMEAAANEFNGALARLQAAPENTPEIRAELEAIALQWSWFQAALAMEGALSYRLVVADASESILNGMDHITRLYERISKR